MRKLLVIFLGLFYVTAFGQNLLNSRKTSYYTYIFKITEQEAKNIYKEDLWEVDQSYFHTLIDSFPTDSNFNIRLNPGHYLKAFYY